MTTQKQTNYPKILLGRHDNENIYLSPPSWDCGWYWGFGYLGNRNCHYHIDGLSKKEDCYMYDAFKKHFGKSLIVRDSQLWVICELFRTFYSLKETAEVLGRGGSHFTSNPCADIITNKDEVKRINEVVLPAIFEAIYKILIPAQDNKKQDEQLVKINLKGDTSKVVDFMLENGIDTDDLKNIEGLTSDDTHIIHGYYWERHHAQKAAKAE